MQLRLIYFYSPNTMEKSTSITNWYFDVSTVLVFITNNEQRQLVIIVVLIASWFQLKKVEPIVYF